MEPAQKSCFNCRWTQPRTPTADLSGEAEYWCAKREQYLGNWALEREVCEDYEPWGPEPAEEEFSRH